MPRSVFRIVTNNTNAPKSEKYTKMQGVIKAGWLYPKNYYITVRWAELLFTAGQLQAIRVPLDITISVPCWLEAGYNAHHVIPGIGNRENELSLPIWKSR